ncbi:MAG: hypothetical protein K9J37_04460 [Saprospiraceae bacterium]|nr:hypothetical protein [Saprospiraceae bacterium]MCF8249138.1 hypothetical protein [Saprospiraceae bacterium]MCF8311267.1 hypothetical protein [Saprospiraceae bacterium]MCF8440169.1 hypothetical protein [Saprospiraceae bacterium]
MPFNLSAAAGVPHSKASSKSSPFEQGSMSQRDCEQESAKVDFGGTTVLPKSTSAAQAQPICTTPFPQVFHIPISALPKYHEKLTV